MVDLSQNQPLNQKPTSDVPVSDQPPVGQPVTPPEKPDDTSPPSITTEEKIATPEQEKIKKELSELGIPPAGGTRKTKVLLAALGILLLIIALPAAVILVTERQEIRKEAVVSGKITVCGIELGPPTNEQPPSEANNGTYSIVVPIKNVSSDSKKVKMQTASCVCNEAGGSPSGKCYGEDKCQNSAPFEVTINSGETYNQTLSAQQPTGVPCGSFQVDLVTLEVNGDTSCSIPWGTPIWGLWLTEKNVEECLAPTPVGEIACEPSSICFPPGECGDGVEIRWYTSNAPDPRVYVVSEDGTETLMHAAPSGSSKPTWLCAGHVAVFKLYANGQSGLLGSCTVTVNECGVTPPRCAKEGEVCYGFAGLACCEGLTCVTEDGLPIQPDKGGICRSGVPSPKPALKPDLIVQDLEIRPSSPVVGNSMSFYGVVKNQGASAATSTSFTHFRLDVDNNGTWDWPFDEATGLVGNDQGTGVLAPGATEKEGVSGWIAKAGTHKLEVCADWAGWVPGQVDESNENNNCTTKTFSVETAPPPEYTAQCDLCKAYDKSWNEITNLSTLAVGQAVYFATLGSTTHPEGITKARFRINGGTWQETTNKHDNELYISYTIPAAGSYTVESMVHNPTLGWY